MQLPTGYLENLVDVLFNDSHEALDRLEEWRECMLGEHWEALKELVEERHPQLIVQHENWLDWNDCDIPF